MPISLSGSLIITGSITAQSITGSISGSLVGNASSASFAQTASSADNFVVRQSLTGSNALFTGAITAQTLVVQTVTSSIVYSSGSNRFGNQLTDVQQMTGSLRVTGSVTVTGGNFVGNLDGNSSTVTNGVYTTGDQTIGGTKTFTSTIAGSINGNAATVTNGVYTNGSYADPSWITSLAGSKISGNISGNAANITAYTINQNLSTTSSPTFSTVTAALTGNASTATVVNGTSGQNTTKDDRIIEPNSITSGRMQFGFTSWANNNGSPYADYLHLRSYTDSSGGNDNLVMFRKDAIGMRIWQQTWDSATAYSSYKDVAWTDGTNATGTWGISITGNAGTATTWATARTLTIGSTGKSVNGSADVTWTLGEIGAAATNQTMHIGTTAVAINRGSAALSLTGVSIDGNSGTVSNGVYTTGDQTIGGTKTFSSTIAGSISGNAATVTNGVYTTGDQTIGGTKTFSTTIAGSITGNAGTLNNLTAIQLFNNHGQNHGTRTSFDATTPSYDFGYRYVQGSGNGPGIGAAGTQYYSWYIGLGNDYPATGAGSYGAMLAINRVATGGTNPYLSIRFNEGNSFSAWSKIYAGYADSAGNSSTVTNGVYTTGDQTIGGNKTFSGITTFSNSGDAQISLVSPDTWAGILFDDTNSSPDYLWYHGQHQTFALGGGGANVSGKKLHVDGGMTVGSSYDATAAPSNGLNVEGAIQQAGSQVVHASNVSSYALPIGGGTVTGRSVFAVTNAGTSYTNMQLETYTNGTGVAGISFHRGGYTAVALYHDGTGLKLDGNLLLTAGNYNSYVPALNGTGATGTWGINITGNAATATSATSATSATLASTVTINDSASPDWYDLVWRSGNTLFRSTGTGGEGGVQIYAAGNYIRCQYLNTTDDVNNGNISSIVAKFGDNYHRSATAAKVAAFISGQSMNISGTATNITAYTINQNLGTSSGPTFAGITSTANINLNSNELRIGSTSTYHSIEVGVGRTGNGFAYIDLIGDTTYDDFGLRIMRGDGGSNTYSILEHRGTGDFIVETNDQAALVFNTWGTTRAVVQSDGDFRPGADNTYKIGTPSYRWYEVYSAIGTINTSDAREKKDISDSDLGLDFITKLRPVSFKMKKGRNIETRKKVMGEDGKEKEEAVFTPTEGKMTHYGLIAQEVKAVIGEKNFAGYVEEEGIDTLGLRYTEFIAPMIKAIQEQQAQIEALKAEIAQLKSN